MYILLAFRYALNLAKTDARLSLLVSETIPAALRPAGFSSSAMVTWCISRSAAFLAWILAFLTAVAAAPNSMIRSIVFRTSVLGVSIWTIGLSSSIRFIGSTGSGVI